MDKFRTRIGLGYTTKPSQNPQLQSSIFVPFLFQKTVYINLPERTDKKNHMGKILYNLKIKAERIEGVKNENRQIGCALAHLKALKLLQQQKNLDNILIFEDDIVPDHRHEIPNIDFEWDMLFLGITRPKFTDPVGAIRRLQKGRCAHAYAVNRSCVDFLIEEVSKNLQKLAVDVVYENNFPKIKAFAFWPCIFRQNKKLGSDIVGHNHG